MSLFIRLQTSFWTSRKTLRLKQLIGNDALWVPPRLWCYAAENQPDGIFKDYFPKEITEVIGYAGDADELIAALVKTQFLEKDTLKIHNWDTHNAYHKMFSERASKAAKRRWEKKLKRQDKTGKEKKRASIAQAMPSICSSNATSNATSMSRPELITEDEFRKMSFEQQKEWFCRIKDQKPRVFPTDLLKRLSGEVLVKIENERKAQQTA